jgi:hypothetical protein
MLTQSIGPRAQLVAIGALVARIEVDTFDVMAQYLSRHIECVASIGSSSEQTLESTGSVILHCNIMPMQQVFFDADLVHLYKQTT